MLGLVHRMDHVPDGFLGEIIPRRCFAEHKRALDTTHKSWVGKSHRMLLRIDQAVSQRWLGRKRFYVYVYVFVYAYIYV